MKLKPETQWRKINETKTCFFEKKINKISKSLARLTKKKKREDKNY